MTSTPESVPEPHSRACGWRPHDHGTACHDNCPTCHGRPVPPAASSPDEGSGGVPLSVPVVRMSGSKDKWHAADDNEATSCGLPLPKGSVLAHARSLDVVNDLCGNCFDVPRLKARVAARRPASADEGAPEGCEIDPVSSRGCERGTPGCVTQHADEGTRQRPDEGPRVWIDADGDVIVGDEAKRLILKPSGKTVNVYRSDDVSDADALAALAAPPAPSTPAPQADEQIRSDAAWIARLARGSSWPGEMAQRVEDACDRVALWAATSPSTPAEPSPRPAPSSEPDA